MNKIPLFSIQPTHGTFFPENLDIQTYPEQNLKPKDGAFNAAMDCGFHIEGDKLFVDNGPDVYKKHKKTPKKFRKAFSEFQLEDKTWKWSHFLEPDYAPDYVHHADLHIWSYWIPMGGQLFNLMEFEGEIYEVKHGRQRIPLSGDGAPLIKEQIPGFVEDTLDLKINFNILDAAATADNKHLCVLYTYQKRPLLEVFEQQPNGLKSVQVIKMEGLEGFENLPVTYTGGSLCIADDYIHFLQLANDQYYLYKYPLKPVYE